MSERWRRELRRLSEVGPSDELLEEARRGPRLTVPEPSSGSRFLAGLVALAVVAAAGAFALQMFGRGAEKGPIGVSDPGDSGYYIRFPAQAEAAERGFSARVTAQTNLPDGTLVAISTTDEGMCCPPVDLERISFTTQNGSCFGPVGDTANSTGFTVTITAKPDFEPFVVPGPADPEPPEQPENVLSVLGLRFEHLSGDQVVEKDGGTKWLVARASYEWPEPQCGGGPIPLFGGPECNPDDFEQQLQGDELEEAMVEVMGAINQGRMCEFWSVMLPPEVEAANPWPRFAEEWRAWLMKQDFSGVESGSGWQEGSLRWQLADRQGDRHFVDVIHDGERIASLELRPLPDYCPGCGPDVVPFWGVFAWTLY